MLDAHRRTARLALVAGLLFPASAAPSAAWAAFECPVKAPPATKPLPGDLNSVVRPYDDPRVAGPLRSDIADMVREGMPRGEVVDHAVDAYCGAVADVPKLTDADRTALVQRFASHVAQVVYAPGDSTVDDILLDVPVPTDLYARVKEAAEQRHETQDAFALAALRRAAGAP